MSNFISKDIPVPVFKWSLRCLFLLGSWLYLWLAYGDVLYQLQEQSLWFFAPLSDYSALRIDMDPFTYVARFCLTLFSIPVLGALVLALCLVAVEYGVDMIFRFGVKSCLLSYIPSIVLLFYIVSHGNTIFYGHENSTVFKVLLTVIVLLYISVPVVRMFVHGQDGRVSHVSLRLSLLGVLILAVPFIFVDLYACRDKEFRTVTSLKYYMDRQKWGQVVKIAENSGVSNRVVAGYHAAALAQLGQIGDRMFKVEYDFPKLSSTGKVDNIMKGDVLCTPQMLFYGGLFQPAYHYAFEYYIIYGNHKEYLKMMVKAIVLNRDPGLAEKLLDIVARMPFEGDFVDKYRSYNANPELMESDKELAPVLDLKQNNEIFEQGLGSPLAVNFYMSISSRVGSQRFQDLALAATLYYKNLQAFANKCNILMKRSYIPSAFQEAVALIAAQSGNAKILQMYKISPEINARVNNFISDQAQYRNTPDKGKVALAPKYRGTLMYYILYENEFLQNMQ